MDPPGELHSDQVSWSDSGMTAIMLALPLIESLLSLDYFFYSESYLEFQEVLWLECIQFRNSIFQQDDQKFAPLKDREDEDLHSG